MQPVYRLIRWSILAVGLIAASLLPPLASAAEKPPNIVFLLADDKC